LLLDSGQLTGSFFHRTVVLICQHDPDGAFGLVLNRATENKVGEVLVADLPESLKAQTLYLGGPVQPAALSYLHSSELGSEESHVLPNLSLGHSLEDLLEIGEALPDAERLRVFAGYAGWAAGQLEDELKREAWVTHPASIELVFQLEPSGLWRRILRQKGWKYKLLSEMPDDLSWN
jgi:putative transcriptional regulator